jgi:Skp family chaperone for outer membrane proteins
MREFGRLGGVEGQERLVLDVHPPNEPVHGWRDFFVHIATITIGLLIALSLERCVEWKHHRNLVHEAEESLREEIKTNAQELAGALDEVKTEQKSLKEDVAVMNRIIANPKKVNSENMTVNFRVRSFHDVSWRTAQSTGAVSYMTYREAQKYADIYSQQGEIAEAERQAVRDTTVAVGPFLNLKKGEPNPGGDEAVKIKDHFEILQGQLMFIESLIMSLDEGYRKFLAAHPG